MSITLEEIRKQAPNGAVFYAEIYAEINYIKCINGLWLIWRDSEWTFINSLEVQSFRNNLRRL